MRNSRPSVDIRSAGLGAAACHSEPTVAIAATVLHRPGRGRPLRMTLYCTRTVGEIQLRHAHQHSRAACHGATIMVDHLGRRGARLGGSRAWPQPTPTRQGVVALDREASGFGRREAHLQPMPPCVILGHLNCVGCATAFDWCGARRQIGSTTIESSVAAPQIRERSHRVAIRRKVNLPPAKAGGFFLGNSPPPFRRPLGNAVKHLLMVTLLTERSGCCYCVAPGTLIALLTLLPA
jgi:hypothetical protein